MFRKFPNPLASPQQRVFRRGFIDQVAHPGVPARFDLAGTVFVLFVVDPAGAYYFRQLLAGRVYGEVGKEMEGGRGRELGGGIVVGRRHTR